MTQGTVRIKSGSAGFKTVSGNVKKLSMSEGPKKVIDINGKSMPTSVLVTVTIEVPLGIVEQFDSMQRAFKDEKM